MNWILDKGRLRRENGQSLPMLVLMIVVLILFVGLGLDMGFAYLTKAALSKSVDAACIAGVRNLFQGPAQARLVALSTFDMNYKTSGVSGRDVAAPTVNANFTTDASDNIVLDVDAAVSINTFFVRVLPAWKTIRVGSVGQATRSKLVMSLVLDRSGSMNSNGGARQLPGAVSTFIDYFDDNNDRVSMNSYAYHARTDVPMGQPFKDAIKSAVRSLRFEGWTASEPGLEKGRQQNQSVTILPNENVTKVIVFFTDGLANTFAYTFNCGVRNIAPDRGLYNPTTGAPAGGGCTVPNSIPSISPPPTTVNTRDSCALQTEAEKRAIVVANTARSEGNIIFAIGLSDPNTRYGECGRPSPNVTFLQTIANDPAGPNYNPNQPAGLAVLGTASQLEQVFQTIASQILLRLTR